MIKLFTVGFARETDEMQLVELFSEHGLVHTVTIIRDQLTGTSKGYAFVDMLDQAGADRAIAALNGFETGGRTISVRVAADKVRKTDANVERAAGTAGKPYGNNQRNAESIKRPRRNRF